MPRIGDDFARKKKRKISEEGGKILTSEKGTIVIEAFVGPHVRSLNAGGTPRNGREREGGSFLPRASFQLLGGDFGANEKARVRSYAAERELCLRGGKFEYLEPSPMLRKGTLSHRQGQGKRNVFCAPWQRVLGGVSIELNVGTKVFQAGREFLHRCNSGKGIVNRQRLGGYSQTGTFAGKRKTGEPSDILKIDLRAEKVVIAVFVKGSAFA